MHLALILAHREQPMPAVPDRVVGAAWQSLRDLKPLVAELGDRARDHLVLCSRPAHAEYAARALLTVSAATTGAAASAGAAAAVGAS
eukprot:CAMPEP_0115853048 /NCGR_PEP_ID=MMETSP0287-20121206/13306_1 /TAXON_ID=412157 /ORGANISM="Chrysochromulina rotalis, Strain UIO044" /LENGTH=86 /DNA_ID=CAMNT_0003307119 /DNA_START=813 /DNA_END=1070 /DNA_ORIENTATION=-